jgi:predicted transcriptional regulator
MSRARLDYLKIQEMADEGITLSKIADAMHTTRGAVSKVLKKMGRQVAAAAVEAAPKHHDNKNAATEHLFYLCNRAKSELEWIEAEVVPAKTEDYRAWQDQKLKFAAEMRKLISAISDIGYRLFMSEEVSEILQIFDEELGLESPECQKRVRERIERRRAIRFPSIPN